MESTPLAIQTDGLVKCFGPGDVGPVELGRSQERGLCGGSCPLAAAQHGRHHGRPAR